MGERHVGSGCGQRGIEIGGKPRDEFVRGQQRQADHVGARKLLGKPVNVLLGGPFREAIPMYSHGIGLNMLDKGSCKEWAARIKAMPEGFNTFKIGIDSTLGVPSARFATTLTGQQLRNVAKAYMNVREAVGEERARHREHPLLNFGYMEVFDVAGGERNLGISLNAFYSENATSGVQMTQDYAYTTASPAYVWDYRSADIYNSRMNKSLTLRVDYRASPSLRFFVNGIYNDAHERSFEYLRTRAYTARSVAPLNAAGEPTGANAIYGNYTDLVTRVRPVAASNFELQTDGNRFEDSQRQIQAGAEHTFARLTLDYDAAHSQSMVRQDDGQNSRDVGSGGYFRTWLTGVGWILDKTADAARPMFTQAGGPSIFDLRNYTNSELNKRANQRNGILDSASVNARHVLDQRGSYLKAGLRYRRQSRYLDNTPYNTVYVGPDGVMGPNAAAGGRNDDNLAQFGLMNRPYPNTKLGKYATPPFPAMQAVGRIDDVDADIAAHPDWWRPQLAANLQAELINHQQFTEEIRAAYVMGDARFGRLRVLTGLRWEETRSSEIGRAHV